MLGHRHALDDVAELHHAGHFGQDGHRERIPFRKQFALLDPISVGKVQAGAIGEPVAFALTAGLVLNDDFAVAIHDDVVLLALGQLHILQLNHAVVARLEL